MPLGPSFIRRNLKWVTSAGSHLWSLVSVISFSLSFTIVSSTMSYLCLSSETIITNANLDQNFHMMVLRCWCLNIFEITFFIPWKVVSIFFCFFSHLTISLLFKLVQAFWILNLAFISSIFHYCIPHILVATEAKKWLALLYQLWNVYCSIQGMFFTNSLLLKILFLGIWFKFSPKQDRGIWVMLPIILECLSFLSPIPILNVFQMSQLSPAID